MCNQGWAGLLWNQPLARAGTGCETAGPSFQAYSMLDLTMGFRTEKVFQKETLFVLDWSGVREAVNRELFFFLFLVHNFIINTMYVMGT